MKVGPCGKRKKDSPVFDLWLSLIAFFDLWLSLIAAVKQAVAGCEQGLPEHKFITWGETPASDKLVSLLRRAKAYLLSKIRARKLLR